MARCAKCGKQVVAGVVLCSQCYEGAGSAPATAEERRNLRMSWTDAQDRPRPTIWKLPATLPDTCTKAAAAIRQLLIRAKEAERQRDAAVADLKDIGQCAHCIHDKPFGYDDETCVKCTRGNHWEWKGAESNVE